MRPATAKPSRILWLFRNYYPELAGGAERFRRYAPLLRERGVEVTVLTASAEINIAAALDHGDAVPVIRIPRPDVPPARIDHALLRHAVRLKGTAENDFMVLQLAAVHWADVPLLLWLRMQGVRIILLCTILSLEDKRRTSWLRRALYWLTGVVTHRVCNTVIVSSSCMAESRVQEGAARRQIEIVCNGVDITRFRPLTSVERAEIRQRLGIPPDAEVLLYIGGIVPRKRVHLLIEAFLKLSKYRPQARLYLVGPMERPTMFHARDQDELARYQAQLYRIAGDHLNHRIFFPGATQEPEAWYNAADLFGFCPENEGFGNVLLEAMSAGTPVVMTRFIGLADELGVAGKHYVLADATAAALATAFQKLLNDPEQRNGLIQHALQWILEMHTREQTLNKLAAVYKQSH